MRANRWLRKRRMAIGDLAIRAGLTRTTVYNLLSGLSKSRTARQKLTNAMGIVMWKGYSPQPPLVLNDDDPSALKTATQLAKQSPAGIQIEVLSTSVGAQRKTSKGFVGHDGHGVILPETESAHTA